MYVGLTVHKGYPDEHAAIITQPLWDKAQSILRESPRAMTSPNSAVVTIKVPFAVRKRGGRKLVLAP